MSAYSRYEDALIAKLRLLEFTTSDMGQRFLRGMQESMNAQHDPSERLPMGMMAALQVQTLAAAEPIYVASEMTDIVDEARKTFEPETLLPSDPFCPHGFALFPRPIDLDDAPRIGDDGVTYMGRSKVGLIPVRAIAWYSVTTEDASQGCFWVSHYTHVDDDRKYGRVFHDPTNTAPPSEEDERHYRFLASIAPLSLVHTWQWAWHTDPRGEGRAIVTPGESEAQSRARAHEQASFVQAFWRIASSIVPVKKRVPRQIWRDALRKKAAETKEVTIITLRRAVEIEGEEFEPSGRHYNVSFLVRGYWATRHTREGPRQVWVRPHIKGDGPFQETDRAWEFKR